MKKVYMSSSRPLAGRNVDVVVIAVLSVYCVLTTLVILRWAWLGPAPPTRDFRPAFYMAHPQDLFDYLNSAKKKCLKFRFIPGGRKLQNETDRDVGHEGTSICLDDFPSQLTEDNCRIYSFEPSHADITFENVMDVQGCRVHMFTSGSEFSYTNLGRHLYFYPLSLGVHSGPSLYTLDNILDLLSHEGLDIHFVKTTGNASETTFLKTFFLSLSEPWNHVKQIRLLLHLPYADNEHLRQLGDLYNLLLGLEYYGYRLVHCRPIKSEIYFHTSIEGIVSRRYEAVWMRKKEVGQIFF